MKNAIEETLTKKKLDFPSVAKLRTLLFALNYLKYRWVEKDSFREGVLDYFMKELAAPMKDEEEIQYLIEIISGLGQGGVKWNERLKKAINQWFGQLHSYNGSTQEIERFVRK